jgi:hypothetical protein
VEGRPPIRPLRRRGVDVAPGFPDNRAGGCGYTPWLVDPRTDESLAVKGGLSPHDAGVAGGVAPRLGPDAQAVGRDAGGDGRDDVAVAG